MQYADGMNLYEYVRSNPQRWLDPQGEKLVSLCKKPGTWSAIAIDHGLTAGDSMDPETAADAIKISAIIEFLATVPKGATDLIGSTVRSVCSASGPKGGFPEGTIATANVVQKIMQERAFMWVEVWCLKCECDKDSSTGYAKHTKHTTWYRCTFSDVDTGGTPRGRFGLDEGIVQDVRKLGFIPLSCLSKKDLNDLKRACQWEAWFKANDICSKSEK
jgi:hypothetical protein